MTAPTMEMDATQIEALTKIQNWLTKRVVDPKHQQVFRLGGHAGSGKTTLLTEVVGFCDAHGIRYRLATFAGKAADVLRRKGLDSAQTIHSLIYVPNTLAMSEIQRINDQLDHADLEDYQREAYRDELKVLKDRQWILRTTLDDCDLLIVDEASMVSGRITNQLKSFGRPILAVGDPAQLPPVELSPLAEPLFYSQKPDAKLEGRHRFGASAILGDVAAAARTNQPIPAEVISPIASLDLTDFDVILVATNLNRWRYIHAVRGALHKPLDQPVVGDRITFWANNYDFGVFNGGGAEVLEIAEGPASGRFPTWSIQAVSDDGDALSLVVDKRGFKDQVALDAACRGQRSKAVVASFSEALTVHKAQGSEWARVLVADHPNAGTGESKVRWRYTAVTRASDVLVLANDAFRTPVRLARGVTLDLG